MEYYQSNYYLAYFTFLKRTKKELQRLSKLGSFSQCNLCISLKVTIPSAETKLAEDIWLLCAEDVVRAANMRMKNYVVHGKGRISTVARNSQKGCWNPWKIQEESETTTNYMTDL